MPCKEEITVCCDNHMKHAAWANAELFYVRGGGTHNYHWPLEGLNNGT
jgi:hypothetical protein